MSVGPMSRLQPDKALAPFNSAIRELPLARVTSFSKVGPDGIVQSQPTMGEAAMPSSVTPSAPLRNFVSSSADGQSSAAPTVLRANASSLGVSPISGFGGISSDRVGQQYDVEMRSNLLSPATQPGGPSPRFEAQSAAAPARLPRALVTGNSSQRTASATKLSAATGSGKVNVSSAFVAPAPVPQPAAVLGRPDIANPQQQSHSSMRLVPERQMPPPPQSSSEVSESSSIPQTVSMPSRQASSPLRIRLASKELKEGQTALTQPAVTAQQLNRPTASNAATPSEAVLGTASITAPLIVAPAAPFVSPTHVTCPRGHVMTSLGTSRDDGWDCDSRHDASGCLSGITGFNQTSGMQRYRCDRCVYDLCEKCYMDRFKHCRRIPVEDAPAPMMSTASATPEAPPPLEPSAGAQIFAAAAAAAAAFGTDPLAFGTDHATLAAEERAVSGLGAGAAQIHTGKEGESSLVPPVVQAPVVEAPPIPRTSTPVRARPALCADPRGSAAQQAANAAASSGAAPSAAATSSTAAPEGASTAENAWSAEWALRLGMDLDSIKFKLPVQILDKDKYFSVNQAVQALNRRQIPCTEDLCVAFSASSRGWYLLYKNGHQELGTSAISSRAHEAASSTAAPTAMPSSSATAGTQPPLAAGAVVRIGRSTCKITTPLGMGSFGAVWAGDVLDGSGGVVAVKEIHCQSPADLNSAVYEGKLLQILSQDQTGSGGATGSSSRPNASTSAEEDRSRIPSLVATETEQLGPSHWRVRLAMSKVPGVPLDHFLNWWQKERPPSDAGPGQRLSEACHFAVQLVGQLATTFERISPHAFHRDVNSHNILVDGGDVLVPSYGLVDFGLAVDLAKWRGPGVSPTSWHLVDIGGDCRYWPMAAWLQFECGWQELGKYPALACEYQTHLDLHAMGITALQVWACMISSSLPSRRKKSEVGRGSVGSAQVSSARGGSESNELPDEVINLHVAWTKYWADATKFWERLLDCFRNAGDQNALKGWCIQEGVHNVIGQDLANVRTALREASQACGPVSSSQPLASGSSTSHPMLAGRRPFFAALLELVSAGGVSGWVEGHQRKTSWQAVRAVLDEASQGLGSQRGGGYPPNGSSTITQSGSAPPPVASAPRAVNPHDISSDPSPVMPRPAGAIGGIPIPVSRSVQSPMPGSIGTYGGLQSTTGSRYAPPVAANGRLPAYGGPPPSPSKIQSGVSLVNEGYGPASYGAKAATYVSRPNGRAA